MGLYDTVYSHYKPLGDAFVGVPLQTKSLDSTMSTYWITPAGELFMIDWADSMEMVDHDPLYLPDRQRSHWALPFQWKPTGKHKKLTPVYYTGSLLVYPTERNEVHRINSSSPWPEATLLFKHGKVIYHETTTFDVK